jgi:hypothetical protein
VRGELVAVRAEGVRDHEPRAGLDERGVHLAHEVAVGQRERVEAGVGVRAAREQAGPGPAVRKQRSGGHERRELGSIHPG